MLQLTGAWSWDIVLAGTLLLCTQAAASKIGWSFQGGEWSGAYWPGCRSGSASWYDSEGDLWLYGGRDSDSVLMDLWKFSYRERHWYSVSPGKAIPPGRSQSSACGTPGVMFVIFGGLKDGDQGFGDTWVYSMVNNTWLMLENQTSPSARGAAATWCTDTHMYVAGGLNLDPLDFDLWQFSLSSLTWVKLESSGLVPGGNEKTGEKKLLPTSRYSAMTWVGANKDVLYIYGGTTNNSEGKGSDYLSDVWSYEISTKTWTWISGVRTPGRPAVYEGFKYGSLITSPSPGGRTGAATWTDPAGDLWLYGGEVLIRDDTDSNTIKLVILGDIWKYNLNTNTWQWTGGKNQSGELRNFGVWGNIGFHFSAGARYGTTAWLVGDRYYIFGGMAHYGKTNKYLSDLWFMKIYPDQMIITLGSVLGVIIPAIILVAVFIVIAIVARGIGHDIEDTSPKYSLLTQSTSFDH